MPSAHHFSHGDSVWVVAGHHSNRQSAEHAAKVVKHVPSSSSSPAKEIMVEWHSTGSAEVVTIDRVRPMYEDDSSDGSDTSRAESSLASSKQQKQPTRKSRRNSKKPDRYDNCFAHSKYQSMSAASLRKKCKAVGIDVRGCAKGDMIALIVKKEEKDRWRRGAGKAGKRRTNESMGAIEESASEKTNNNVKAPSKKSRPKKKKSSVVKATKPSSEPVEKPSIKKNSTSTPRNVHLSQRLCAIFSPTGSNKQPVTKPRRISEIRRRRNNMEERVRTKLLTARKKSREDIEMSEVRQDKSGGSERNKADNCKQLFCNASEASNITSPEDISTDLSELSSATVCYPMPNSHSTSITDPTQIQPTEEDAVQIHLHNPDFIQTLYGRLHLAKADYIQSLKALQQLKSDGEYEADDIVELETWKNESRANVDKLRTMLNEALEKSTDAPSLIHV